MLETNEILTPILKKKRKSKAIRKHISEILTKRNLAIGTELRVPMSLALVGPPDVLWTA